MDVLLIGFYGQVKLDPPLRRIKADLIELGQTESTNNKARSMVELAAYFMEALVTTVSLNSTVKPFVIARIPALLGCISSRYAKYLTVQINFANEF